MRTLLRPLIAFFARVAELVDDAHTFDTEETHP